MTVQLAAVTSAGSLQADRRPGDFDRLADTRGWPVGGVSEYRLVVQAPHGRVFSVNDDHSKGGRWKVTGRRNAWMHDTWIEAKHAKIPALGRIEVEPTIHLRNWRRADAHNYPGASSLKGLLDGLVAAGVVEDDRAPFMDVRMPRLAPLNGGPPRVELVIRVVAA